MADGRRQIADSRLQTGDCKQQTTESRKQRFRQEKKVSPAPLKSSSAYTGAPARISSVDRRAIFQYFDV
jgi:hypothetical protein